MSAGWVAPSVRARALARRRLGRAGARELAESPSISAAVEALSRTSYGRDVQPGMSLEQAQRAASATLLWHLRVLAGWLPLFGKQRLRVLAGWFEMAAIEDHLSILAGRPTGLPAYRVGALSTVWTRVAATGGIAELAAVLASSPWGDCGSTIPEIRAEIRHALARRVAEGVPTAAIWAAGADALLQARENLGADPPLPVAVWAAGLPRAAAWALGAVDGPDDLWLAEARWWRRVEGDAARLLAGSRAGFDPVLGAVALLAVDAWRVTGALELAARGGGPLEVFDVVA